MAHVPLVSIFSCCFFPQYVTLNCVIAHPAALVNVGTRA